MKLHRFTASTNQKAIAMIHEALGPDALVYSTRTVDEGIEIVAGLPSDYEEHHDNKAATPRFHDASHKGNTGINGVSSGNVSADVSLFEKLNDQLQLIKDSMQNLSNHVDRRLHERFDAADDEQTVKRNRVFYHLNLLGFKGKFCQQFINNYFTVRDYSDPVTLSDIQSDLMHYIQTTESDIVDGKNVCALIGPTGIGKTTTILKLAQRYITKYGADKLGIITTDFHDISGKHMLLHYQNKYNFDLEYADTASELAMVLISMKKKDLVLIDTHGVSQRDAHKVVKLVDLMESQGNKISSFIVLPGNVQEPILDDIARAFKTTNLSGCILTKQDECINISTALSVALKNNMKIAYICNGQDIDKDIVCANKEKILFQIMNESMDNTQDSEPKLFNNHSRISDNSNEGRYAR